MTGVQTCALPICFPVTIGCAVLVAYDKQSPDIAQGVDKAHDDGLDQGAGDQGLMFGYAVDNDK